MNSGHVYQNRDQVVGAIRQAVRDLLLTPPTGGTLDTLVATALTAAATTAADGSGTYTPESIAAAVLSAANVTSYGTKVGVIQDLHTRVGLLEGEVFP